MLLLAQTHTHIRHEFRIWIVFISCVRYLLICGSSICALPCNARCEWGTWNFYINIFSVLSLSLSLLLSFFDFRSDGRAFAMKSLFYHFVSLLMFAHGNPLSIRSSKMMSTSNALNGIKCQKWYSQVYAHYSAITKCDANNSKWTNILRMLPLVRAANCETQ